jgi:uncharacterized membrane protein YhaH (DUF805 family)
MFALFNILISIGLGIIDEVIGVEILGNLYSLGVFLPGIAVAVRRLHDVGKSGWMYLLIFLPVIGWIWLIVLFATEGETGTNKYGDDPKGFGSIDTESFGLTETDINTEAQEQNRI